MATAAGVPDELLRRLGRQGCDVTVPARWVSLFVGVK